jgi:hypothetical protein
MQKVEGSSPFIRFDFKPSRGTGAGIVPQTTKPVSRRFDSAELGDDRFRLVGCEQRISRGAGIGFGTASLARRAGE